MEEEQEHKSFYDEERLEELEENDEISPWEEGFMIGYISEG